MMRLCPLCDQDWDKTTCPVHGVPTIGPARGPARRLEVGTVLVERFRIDGLLGQGGMGALLSATDLQIDRPVVVKVLRGERVGEIANVRRFYQEARAVRALSHPNIVHIVMFGVDEITRAPFLAMEFVPGCTLKARLAEDGPLDERTTATLFVQIAQALAAAHRAQVLHRDLKPSNIMVDGPKVKVLDFGLAKILEDPATAPLTQPGKTVGTPAFMSPEQVTQRTQDFRTDLYGLGCVLHAALTGNPPFTGADLIEVMRKQMRAPAPPLPSILANGEPPSPALQSLHQQLLAKDPADRPKSTEAVVLTLAELRDRRPFRRTSRFEQADTQIDLRPGQALARPRAGRGLANLENDDPKAGPTTRLPLEDLPDHDRTAIEMPTAQTVASDDDVATPHRSFDPDVSDADSDSLTSIVPASPSDGTPQASVTFAASVATHAVDTAPAEVFSRAVQADREAGRAQWRARHLIPGARRLVTPPLATPARRDERSRRDRHLWPVASAVVAAFAALAVIGSMLVPASSPAPTSNTISGTTDPTPSVAQAPPPTVIPPGPALVPSASKMIEIRSRPPGAEVVIEDEWIGRTPIALDRPPGGQAQRLVIRQTGYEAQIVELQPNAPSLIEIVLERR